MLPIVSLIFYYIYIYIVKIYKCKYEYDFIYIYTHACMHACTHTYNCWQEEKWNKRPALLTASEERACELRTQNESIFKVCCFVPL